MRLNEALAESKPLDVKFATAVLHVEYRPPAYTIEQMVEAEQDKGNPERLVAMIRKIVTAWDLDDDNGEPISLAEVAQPEDPDAPRIPDPLKTLVPFTVFNAIIRAIREDNAAVGELGASDAG